MSDDAQARLEELSAVDMEGMTFEEATAHVEQIYWAVQEVYTPEVKAARLAEIMAKVRYRDDKAERGEA